MKNLLIILLISTSLYAQQQDRFEIDVVIDGSRLIEDKSEYDSGLDITAIVNLDRHAFLSPTIRFEAFPNLNFYRFGVGPEYFVHLKRMDLSLGVEVGILTRKRPGLESYGNWWTYGVNGAIRIFLTEKFLIVTNYNYLRRPDFQMWGAEPDFVGSLFLGVGHIF